MCSRMAEKCTVKVASCFLHTSIDLNLSKKLERFLLQCILDERVKSRRRRRTG